MNLLTGPRVDKEVPPSRLLHSELFTLRIETLRSDLSFHAPVTGEVIAVRGLVGSLHLHGSHEAHGGDADCMFNDLSRLAGQLAEEEEQPPVVIGVSSRDVISVASRKLDVHSYTVSGVPATDRMSILLMANAAREARNRRPCPYSEMYGILMPIDEFITKFAKSS